MESIAREQWDSLLTNKRRLVYYKLNELIPHINKNNKTDFRLFEELEGMQSALDHWNNIIDYLNEKYQRNINHVYTTSTFEQVFNIINDMITLENTV